MDNVELNGNPDLEIENIEYDSRLVRGNGLFVAIKGFKQDGYDFVEQAKKNGAVAVIGEQKNCRIIENNITVPNVRKAMSDIAAKYYGYPGNNIKACGVTGTNGKTTTCYLIKNILKARNKTTGLITSQGYDTGKETFPAERTTPESLDLQRLLFLMKKNCCVNVVIEVSSHALVLHRVDNIDFTVAVYTNLTRDHLDFHKTMEKYLEAKASLISKLKGVLRYVVVNIDVPEFRKFFGDFESSYMTYSIDDTNADVYCDGYEIKPDKTIFNLVTPMGTRTVSLNLPGRFNLMNAIAAATGGLANGIDLDNVVRGLESSEPIPGRFNYINEGQPFAIYVDYAHTPDAIERLCQSVREIVKGKLFILFGCGGDRDKGKRPLMGKVATTNADFTIVTSDNPRSEDPLVILQDVKPGLIGQNYEIIPERREAIRAIFKKAQPDDVVLLAGKGDENYQEINGVRHPFCDID
ncbi:MAG: UDP-N-acetylmuramoyl-L-alanyl-D-glutamate--2,6-diaminopimelate ligase, partial [Candidatus Zixiibacteriota bacterium]